MALSEREPYRGLVYVALALWFVPACDGKGTSSEASALRSAAPLEGAPLGPPPSGPAPRAGMAYIPPGALVVGTARDKRPRRPDRELSGEQIMLEGFYMDQLAYPNEEGAIPLTNVTQSEAEALCGERGKRLCSELEWERACKGPDNRSFEYGEAHRESACKTGRPAELRPSGYLAGCQSDFGVRDMHGGPFEWTASEYGRGTSGTVALRGGNGIPGEVYGRCANVEPGEPQGKSGTIGFRCCAGLPNPAKVEFQPRSVPGLQSEARVDDAVFALLLEKMSESARQSLERGGKLKKEKVWLWRPIVNEELLLLGICGRGKPPPFGPSCGLLIARAAPGELQVLDFGETGRLVPALHGPGPLDMLWMVGGDSQGSYKRLLTYRYGDVSLGEFSRGLPKKPTKAKPGKKP